MTERGTTAARPHRFGRFPRILFTSAVFSILLLGLSAAVGTIAYKHYDGQITRDVGVLSPNDTNVRERVRQLHAANYLVIGSDSRAGVKGFGHDVVGARSDTTMVVHLSPNRKKATVVSIPRDAWLAIPTCKGKTGKIAAHVGQFNSAFTAGGAACTIATVQKLTGIEIKHYVEINFTGFERIINALGSITVCSPAPVNDVNSKLVLKAGNNTLNGAQALAYVRARDTLGDGSDLGRIKRQQRFLGAVLRQARGGNLLSSPGKLTRFLDAATKAVIVDDKTSIGDLKTLFDVLRGLDPKKVTFYTAPIANQAYNPEDPSQPGGRVLLDAKAGRTLYDTIINDATATVGGTKTPTPSAGPTPKVLTVAPAQISVTVTNGVGTRNLATKVQGQLTAIGFGAGDLNLMPQGATTTLVEYGPTQIAAARTVAAALPNSKLVADAGHQGDIEVVVGSSYIAARKVRAGDPIPSWVKTPTSTPSKSPSKSPTGISAADTTCTE